MYKMPVACMFYTISIDSKHLCTESIVKVGEVEVTRYFYIDSRVAAPCVVDSQVLDGILQVVANSLFWRL